MTETVDIHITKEDIFMNTCNFETHRHYIEWRFFQKGVAITKWRWEKSDAGWQVHEDGLEIRQDDSNVNLSLHVIATLGVNARRILEVEKAELKSRIWEQKPKIHKPKGEYAT